MSVVTCPKCQRHCPVPKDTSRVHIQCPNCNKRFTVTRMSAGTPASAVVDRRVRRNGRIIRLSCPCCVSPLNLCRRQRTEVELPALVSVPAVAAEALAESEALPKLIEDPPPSPPPPPNPPPPPPE